MLIRRRQFCSRTLDAAHGRFDRLERFERLVAAHAELRELARARQPAAFERPDGLVVRADTRLERAAQSRQVIAERAEPRVQLFADRAYLLRALGQRLALPAATYRMQEREKGRGRGQDDA